MNATRFLLDFRPTLTRKYLPEHNYRSLNQENVVGISLRGPARVYDLTTDAHTYICEGFVVHNCEAPMLSGRKIRKHSIPYLRELLLHLRTGYDVTHVNIVDDNFSFYPAYVLEFCEMVLSEPRLADLTFATPNGLRVERSTAEMFKAMRRAGWSRVIFAPESGSQRMTDIMSKGLKLEVVPERVEWAHAAGLEVEAFFILNYPGETDADVRATRDFIERVPFDEISLHIFKPLPHTPIWRQLVDEGKLDPAYVIGRYDEIDWLANGRSVKDIQGIVKLYQSVRPIYRVA